MPRTRVIVAATAVALLTGLALAPASAQAETLHALCSKNVPLPMDVADPTGMTDLQLSERGVSVCLVY